MQKFSLVVPVFLASAALAQTAPKAAATPAQSSPSAAGAQAAPPSHPAPAHPLTAAQAHEISSLTGTDKVKPRLIDSIMSYTQRAFPPFIPSDVREDVKSSLDKLDVDSSTTATYQKYLSTEDAAQIIGFYKTPAGKNLLEVTPALTQEVQQNALKQAQTTFQAVMERHKTEIETAEKTYQQQHPAPSLGGPGAGPGSGPAGPGASGSPAPKAGASGSSAGSSGTGNTGGSAAPKKPQ